MKKIICVLLSALLCLAMLCGCSGSVEVNNRTFVQVLGIDKVTDNYYVYLKAFDTGENSAKALYGTGKTILSALSNAQLSQENQVFLGHVKLMVLGDGITEPQKELSVFLDGSISPSCFLTYSDNPHTIVYDSLDEYWDSEYLTKKMDNLYSQGTIVYSTLADVLSAKESYYLPVISTNYKSLEFDGLRAVNTNENVIKLSDEQIMGVRLLRDDFRGNDTIDIPVMTSKGYVTVSVKSIHTSAVPKLNGYNIVHNVKIDADAVIKENPENISRELIEIALNQQLRKYCENSFYYCINENNCDIINLNKLVLKYCPNAIGFYEMNLQNTVLNVSVKTDFE